MIRIRFHGRGGHGVKTASRIVGTAAFMAGRQCQDSPVYGAERRGAAVVAFTRIADEPILERGVIAHPNLIIVADETLLKDSGAAVLAGQETADAVFVNTRDGSALAEQFSIQPRLICFDVTGRTLEITGVAAALSAGLGAVAARLSGVVSRDHLIEAVREELANVGLRKDSIERNVQIAGGIFDAVPLVCRPLRHPQIRVGPRSWLWATTGLCREPPASLTLATPISETPERGGWNDRSLTVTCAHNADCVSSCVRTLPSGLTEKAFRSSIMTTAKAA